MVLSLPALVVPFVPFACDTSPVGVLVEAPHRYKDLDRESVNFMLVALPLVLGAATAAWRVRVLWKPATVAERLIAHAVGAVMAICAAALILELCLDGKGMDLSAALTLGAPAALLLIALAACIVCRRRWTPDEGASASLICGYVPAASLAMLIFWKDRQIGWYLTLAPVAAGLIEFVVLLRVGLRGRWRRGRRARMPIRQAEHPEAARRPAGS
jgi:hypothetical protein